MLLNNHDNLDKTDEIAQQFYNDTPINSMQITEALLISSNKNRFIGFFYPFILIYWVLFLFILFYFRINIFSISGATIKLIILGLTVLVFANRRFKNEPHLLEIKFFNDCMIIHRDDCDYNIHSVHYYKMYYKDLINCYFAPLYRRFEFKGKSFYSTYNYNKKGKLIEDVKIIETINNFILNIDLKYIDDSTQIINEFEEKSGLKVVNKLK